MSEQKPDRYFIVFYEGTETWQDQSQGLINITVSGGSYMNAEITREQIKSSLSSYGVKLQGVDIKNIIELPKSDFEDFKR